MRQENIFRSLTKFEHIGINIQTQRYHLSKLCELLLIEVQEEDCVKSKWELDIREEFWREFSCNQKFSTNVGIRENCYKLFYRQYLTLARLAKLYSAIQNKCGFRQKINVGDVGQTPPLFGISGIHVALLLSFGKS